MSRLADCTAPNAFYNAEQRHPPPNCLPETRIEILADLNDWIMDRASDVRVCWIHGSAGVGKSAIMQNVSETHASLRLADHIPPRLAASFFFSRDDDTRDKLDPFVATIVYQFLMSESLRAVLGPSIIEAIRSDPNIFHTTSENQFKKLILEPCSKIDQGKWKNLPNVLVIDGLDECLLIPSQERLIAMIREAIAHCPLVFLLASRPEPRIWRALEHEVFASSLRRLAIGNSDESTRDITMYLHVRFSHLQKTHPLLRHIDVSWPGEGVIQELVARACGQFIFVVTVMKYLDSDDEDPTERLEDILRIRADDLPESPYPDLDLLYRQILVTCSRWNTIRQVLRLVITMPTINVLNYGYLPRSPECIAALLDFKPGMVQSLLFRMHAVLEVPEDDSTSIHIPHASFTEFLLDPTRSRDFHVQPLTTSDYHDLLAQTFLRVISIFSLQYQFHVSRSTLIDRKAWIFLYPNCSLFSVFRLILLLTESPSTELLAALDKFDPYPYATRLLNWKTVQWPDMRDFNSWRDTIEWAKASPPFTHTVLKLIQRIQALGSRAPRVFLNRMETFLHSFYIGSWKATSTQLCSVTAFLEAALYIPHNTMSLSLMYSWPRLFYDEGTGDIYILPANRDPPSSWTTSIITQENGNRIARVLVSLATCNTRDLIDDIYKGTYKSVSHLPKKNELHVLKKLVAHRQQEFGIEPFPCTPPLSPANGILYGMVNAFCQCLQAKDQQDSNARLGDEEVNPKGIPLLLLSPPQTTRQAEASAKGER
ncbi:hypothetical protein VNI00_018238 [Paramarasmius palmivorus]|uniref:NACHT domain-containing protein n=1 Tax=Paramarasmius palmivorus TaxID=297713 RepID=A0AAW0B0Q0_9AGAR